jgi:NADP-dependent 3-hydroxy acid dehydrogenase YdfG
MIAEGFAANGAKVYITGRREGTLKDSADDVNNKILEQNVYMISELTQL